jgi:hypothetical protein
MRPIYQTITGAAASAPVSIDHYISPCQLSLTGLVGTGAPNFSFQYTVDNIWLKDFDPATATWLPITGATGVLINTSIQFSIPCTAIRCVNTIAATTVQFIVIQAGQSGVS